MTDDERPHRGGPRLARGLAAARRRALRGGTRDRRGRPADGVGGLAARARDALPDPPPVAGPGRRARRLPGHHWPYDARLRFEVAVDAPAAARRRRSASAGSRSPRSSCPTAATNRSPSTGSGASGSRSPTATRPRRCSGCAATRAACSCPSSTRPTGPRRTAPGRYLLDTAKSADLGGDAAPGRSSWTSTSRSTRRAPSTRSWACPLARPTTGSRRGSRRASGCAEPGGASGPSIPWGHAQRSPPS